MKKILIILILFIFNELKPGFFNFFHEDENLKKKEIQEKIENISLKDNTNLIKLIEDLSKCVKFLTEQLTKIEFKIFNINCQKGHKVSTIANNENLNNLENKNSNYQFITNIKNNTKEKYLSALAWIKNNKLKSTTLCFTSIYFSLNTKLIFLTYQLSKNNIWANWRISKDIEELYIIPQKTLVIDLLKDINVNYLQFGNIKDNITPISNFIIDVNKEINYLKIYKKMIGFLISIKLDKIFIYNKKIYLDCEKKLNRLTYIKSIFLSWLIDNKLNQPNNTNYF